MFSIRSYSEGKYRRPFELSISGEKKDCEVREDGTEGYGWRGIFIDFLFKVSFWGGGGGLIVEV
jgi:hypothetical protein